jgi:secreted PhoX family phosphatase
MNRRELLALLGIGMGSVAFRSALWPRGYAAEANPGGGQPRAAAAQVRPFAPVPYPLPLPSDGLGASQQRDVYGQVTLQDRVVVPEGFRADVLATWGEPLGKGRFGFNNDYLAFNAMGGNRALLTVNFEYISPRVWSDSYAEVIGAALPFQSLAAKLGQLKGDLPWDSLAQNDPLRQLVLQVATAAMADLGIGVCSIERQADGAWKRRPGRHDRRITGLTGWEDPAQRLAVSGPAREVFSLNKRLGYDDGLGDRIIGTFANCAGGQTPWGTVLSAEENFHNQVVEAVFADGSSAPPAQRPFVYDGKKLEGLGHPFGLAGNKYGWMVEIDPFQPQRTPIKHSWLGRFRHEAVAIKAQRGQPLVVYSGCDRYGGHLYRFVSESVVQAPQDRSNSRLFEQGHLEVARFGEDGSGQWIRLTPQTPIQPQYPSHYEQRGVPMVTLLPHSDRRRPGAERFATDASIDRYRQRFKTLADLYPGLSPGQGQGQTQTTAQMGAILIDAHLAATAVGATATARPEDTEIDPSSGDLLVTFTAGGSDGEGRADPAIFHGPARQASWPHGWIMRLQDDGPQGSRFRWRMVASGGLPWEGGMGFTNPDNLALDPAGNLWMVTDRLASRECEIFGNNSCWLLPAHGAGAGEPLCFATAPVESEFAGPCFDPDGKTLFLAVQHPGEDNGIRSVRQSGAGTREAQGYTLSDRDGQPFEQLRWVPLGSNWPSGPGRAPRPAVVAIRRQNGTRLLEN